MATSNKTKKQKAQPWKLEEEERLIANVKHNITNLTKAFAITSKEIQRTPQAISSHWYTNTSIKGNHALFLTVSGKHVAVNRKNGKGKPCSVPLYKKVLALFGLTY